MGKNGFTLIELLVVLAMLAVLLAVVPPLLPNAVENAKVRSARRELISGLRFARSNAVISQRDVTFNLNVKGGAMTIAGQELDLNLPDKVKLTLITAQQEQSSEYEGAIRFYPDGSSTGGQISLRQGEHVSYIDVNWLTGQITSAAE